MRKRQEPEERKKRILKKRTRSPFRGSTNPDRWGFIRALQVELMQKGVDEQIAFLNAKREYRKEQKHLKAYLKGAGSFRFGTTEEESNGQKREVPNILKVL